MYRVPLLLLALCLSLCPCALRAQTTNASITGLVTDPSKAVIADAKVATVNTGTNFRYETATNGAGEYTLAKLPPGTYRIEVEKSGFKKLIKPSVTLHVQDTLAIDFQLPVGAAVETVVVQTGAPLLNTSDATVSTLVDQTFVESLPLNGRNFTFLAQLSAGITQGQQDLRGLGASGSFAANGLRPAQNNYLLDGIDNNSNLVDFLNGTAYAVKPPLDAVQEFKVETGNYSAELGRSAGAVLNATLRSGTNAFHGAAWEFLRNDKLDAANFFENAGDLKKGKFRQNQFGATFGGPMHRDKTFFFLDYEGTRIRQATPYTSTVPTALERSSGYANLSELLSQGPNPTSCIQNPSESGCVEDVLGRGFTLGQVFDPSTTRPIFCGVRDPVSSITPPCPTGASTGTQIGFAREPFPGNILPASRLDANAIKLLNLFPAPNNPGLFNNYSSNPVVNNHTDQFDVRVDHYFSSKDTAFARVSYVNNPEIIPGPFGGIADGGAFYAGDQNAKSWNSALSETHQFSPSFVNEIRVGYNNLSATRVQPNATTEGIPAQCGIQGIPQGNSNGGLGSIFMTGLTALGSSEYLPSLELSTTSQITDNLSKTLGRHSFKVGFQWQRLGFSILQPPSGRGAWSFSGLYTEVPTTTGGNTGFAQMLLTPIPATVPGAADYVGGADSISASNIANTSMQHRYYAGYFQDDFKVTSKLTLNLGLRYEYFGQLIENYGAQSNFLPGANKHSTFLLTAKRCNTPLSADFRTAAATDGIDIVCSSQPGLGVSQKWNFSPRLGFAYQLTPKLIARGGYGIFYGGFENSVVETYVDFPFQFMQSYSYQVPNAPITFSNGSIGTLETGFTGIPLTSAAIEPAGVSFTGEDYHVPTPYTQGYNLTVQYQLGGNDSVQAGYVGNTVHHLGTYVNPNTPWEILPPGLNALSYSPYPDFSSYMVYSSFAGDSHYNSLQVNYERRVGHGLNVLANFTWASCISDAADVLNPTALTSYRAPFLPHFGMHGDFGRCDFDINKVVHLSGIYELPFGHGRPFGGDSGGVVNAIVGGWDANWILTLQDGQPGTVPCVIATTSGFGCYALQVPGVNPYAGKHNVDQWLNPAAFATPPVAATIGQADYSPLGGGPSNFRGPGFHRMDFALFKQFQLTERFRLEFRSEFFNLTNHPNFSNPGSTLNGVPSAPGALNYNNPTNFGKITSTRDGQNDQREIQFALKLYY